MASKIAEYAERQKAYQDRVDTALKGLQVDIDNLNEQIVKLQATSGQVTAEDQALLDQIEASAAALAAKSEALDGLTPPPVPTEKTPPA